MLRYSAFLLLTISTINCAKSDPPPGPAPAPVQAAPARKDPDAARKLIASGAVVLDVRTPDEVATGHLPGATNIPIAELPTRLAEVEKLTGGDKTKPIVAYCASGGRSGKAKQALEAAGYTNVVNGGGYDDLTD